MAGEPKTMKRPEIHEHAKILVVDDDQQLLESMGNWLNDLGYQTFLAQDFASAGKFLSSESIDVALVDVRLGTEDGFEILKHCRQHFPNTQVLLMTGYATINTGIDAIRAGAFDLLTKPLIDEELLISINRALSQRQVMQENHQLKVQLDRRFGMENVVGSNAHMEKIYDVVDSVADTRATVLITGESGTGKSLIARAIHQRSDRREAPFVEIACGALPENLLESELFGHVAGSFTGAVSNKQGKFKLADGGTIFLDEIGTASPSLQVKLLRVLQDLEFEQVGGAETHKVNTRVILATNEDLSAAVAEGRFREDLFYRINVINLPLPPLRQRQDDVMTLAEHFLSKYCSETGRSILGFDTAAARAIQNYAWPGNVRELQNVMERAVLLGKSNRITLDDLPTSLTDCLSPVQSAVSPSGKQTLKEAMMGPERQIILQVLREKNWNRSETADQLGVNRTTLYKKMKRLGLDQPNLVAF